MAYWIPVALPAKQRPYLGEEAGGAGVMEMGLGWVALALPSTFEAPSPAAGDQDTGWGQQFTLVRNWAPFGLNIEKSRDTCLKHI